MTGPLSLSTTVHTDAKKQLAQFLWKTLRSSCCHIDSVRKHNPFSQNRRAFPLPTFLWAESPTFQWPLSSRAYSSVFQRQQVHGDLPPLPHVSVSSSLLFLASILKPHMMTPGPLQNPAYSILKSIN